MSDPYQEVNRRNFQAVKQDADNTRSRIDRLEKAMERLVSSTLQIQQQYEEIRAEISQLRVKLYTGGPTQK